MNNLDGNQIKIFINVKIIKNNIRTKKIYLFINLEIIRE